MTNKELVLLVIEKLKRYARAIANLSVGKTLSILFFSMIVLVVSLWVHDVWKSYRFLSSFEHASLKDSVYTIYFEECLQNQDSHEKGFERYKHKNKIALYVDYCVTLANERSFEWYSYSRDNNTYTFAKHFSARLGGSRIDSDFESKKQEIIDKARLDAFKHIN